MNREIKFRSWCKNIGKMCEVGDIHFGIDCVQVYEPDEEFDFEDIVLMQFTGLKDNKGIEIYEGDIVTIIYRDAGFPKMRTEEIIYRQESAMFDTKWVDDFYRAEMEVIGNVYEHPDLIKEKAE